ncbi:hypothetical protein HDU77_008878 [Chytriomyces hyalinus]|nr:hypothetical protein HDU77_008878 [Chytriomyces hyalinus]
MTPTPLRTAQTVTTPMTNTPPETPLSQPTERIEAISAEQTLFRVPFHMHIKEFRNQQPQQTIDIIITADDVDSFIQQLWTAILPHIKRGIIIQGDSCAWAHMQKHELTVADVDNYALIQNMHNSAQGLWVFQYSDAVVNANMFKLVKKKLLDPAVSDQSGAAAQSEQLAMLARLKEHHRADYQSLDINWRMWANYVLAGDASFQEERFLAAPPRHMFHLFAAADTNHAVVNRSLARGNRVALESNGRFAIQINQLMETYCGVKRSMEQAFGNALEDATEIFEARLHAIQEDIRSREEMLTAIQDSMPVQMTGYSAGLLDQVENQEDVDHQ